MSKPSVMLLVCSYQHGPYLHEALDSILEQTYGNIQVLILDDGSKDGSQAVIDEYVPKLQEKTDYKCTYLALPENQGHLQAFYFLIEYYKHKMEPCDYVQILETDDALHKDSIKRRVEYLQEHPEADGVHTDVMYYIPHMNQLSKHYWKDFSYPIESPLTEEFLLKDNRVFTCAFMSKHKFFIKCYDYDIFDKLGLQLCDYAAIMRMVHLGAKIHYIDEALSLYRKILTSVTNSMSLATLRDKTEQVKKLTMNKQLFEDLNG